MKKVKQPKSKIHVIFEGGATMMIPTTHSLAELERIMDAGFDSGKAVLDNIEDDANVADCKCVLHTEKVMSYVILELNATNIVTPNQPGKLVKLQ